MARKKKPLPWRRRSSGSTSSGSNSQHCRVDGIEGCETTRDRVGGNK